MIKLTQLINELGINNPNPTVEEVHDYLIKNIYNYYFYRDGIGCWREYLEICKPYCQKYGIDDWIGSNNEFSKLSQPDLNKLYKEMKQIIQKYAN